jgi:hypothetical protein
MPFGKYYGCELPDVPSSYLVWCLEEMATLQPSTRHLIEHEMTCRVVTWPFLNHVWKKVWHEGYAAAGRDGKPPALSAREPPEAIKACFRRLCLRYHPDRGGSTDAMTAINELYAAVVQACSRGP